MNTVKIPFKGITRNTDDGLCQDGECMELINARIANNSVEPVSTPILKATFLYTYTKIYFHAIADMYIAIKSDKTLVSISKDLSSAAVLSTSLAGVIGVEFIGNIVCALTENAIEYLIYKNNSYLYLGTLPELPEITIDKNLTIRSTKSDSQFGYNITSRLPIEKSELWIEYQYGYYQKILNLLNKDGFFFHSTCFRIAFRLYDGTYIKHSPIRLIRLDSSDTVEYSLVGYPRTRMVTLDGGDNSLKVYCEDENTTADQYWYFAGMGFKPTFTYNSFNLENWRDIIVSIDIFASSNIRTSILGNKFENLGAEEEQLKNTSKFYRIASIDLKGNITYKNKDVSKDSLSLEEELTDDQFTHNTLIANSSYTYNSRLHLYDINSILYDGYNLDYLVRKFSSSKTGNTSISVYTYIKTNNYENIVCKTKSFTQMPESITPYLMYPDSRAYKIVITINYNNGVEYRSKEFSLTPHNILNAAIYLGEDSDMLVSSWDTTAPVIVTSKQPETDKQKLKVSSLNNPFFFPARTTYQFQSNIIAIQSNTTALSQGQFGQFPLYVFCKDGVHAMQVGTDVVYATSVPVSRDVCIGSTCGIDSAVVFPTDRGLMMIAGTQCQCISEAMDGWLPSCTISSEIIHRIMGVGGMNAMLSSVVFNDYLRGANIGYNYQQSEIIVANSTYPYSYVFNMKSQSWHKIDMSINSFVNVYPETYAIVLNNIYDLNNNHRSVSRIALLTRPIKFGTTTHKRVLQSALRGIIKRALSDLYLRGEAVQFRGEDLTIFKDVGFYMLGSNDAEHYELINGKESIIDLRDLVTKMNKSKPYKYFMLCIVGGLRSDVSINYIEMMVDESFTNRLR